MYKRVCFCSCKSHRFSQYSETVTQYFDSLFFHGASIEHSILNKRSFSMISSNKTRSRKTQPFDCNRPHFLSGNTAEDRKRLLSLFVNWRKIELYAESYVIEKEWPEWFFPLYHCRVILLANGVNSIFLNEYTKYFIKDIV